MQPHKLSGTQFVNVHIRTPGTTPKQKGDMIMTLIRWNPVRDVTAWHPVNNVLDEFSQIHRALDSVFDNWRGGSSGEMSFMPAVDIIERENIFDIRIELPGVKKEDVKITVNNGVLTVKGEKKVEQEKKGENYHRVERSYGSFQRSFNLPTTVSSDKIEASYDNGVLNVSVPKIEEAKPKEIEVRVK
jgi:HSP20 family protein